MALELVWVRHGVTEWNLKRVLQGHSDVPLSQDGHLQAQRLAQHARSLVRPDVLFSSDLRRARETAEYLAEVWQMPLELTSDLRERGFGIYEGQDWDAVQHTLEEQARAAGVDEHHFRPTGGESRLDVEQRLLHFLGRLMKQHANHRVWIVSHGGIIRHVLRRLVRSESHHLSSGFHIPNTSLSTLRFESGVWQAGALVAMPHGDGRTSLTQETKVETLLNALLLTTQDESEVLTPDETEQTPFASEQLASGKAE